MISIITPTMWKYKRFPENITATLEESVVDEYIIINNDNTVTPKSEILSHPKIKIYDFNKNMYVNPSWNFGASVAQNDILAFLSDDVEFDSTIFTKVYEFMQKINDIAFLGVMTKYHRDSKSAQIYDDYYTDGSVNFVSEFPTSTFGAFFFMSKQAWKPIPEELKIVNGDCLQFNRCAILQKKVFMAVNCYSESPWHVTFSTIPEEIIRQEDLLYKKINEETDWTHV